MRKQFSRCHESRTCILSWVAHMHTYCNLVHKDIVADIYTWWNSSRVTTSRARLTASSNGSTHWVLRSWRDASTPNPLSWSSLPTRRAFWCSSISRRSTPQRISPRAQSCLWRSWRSICRYGILLFLCMHGLRHVFYTHNQRAKTHIYALRTMHVERSQKTHARIQSQEQLHAAEAPPCASVSIARACANCSTKNVYLESISVFCPPRFTHSNTLC